MADPYDEVRRTYDLVADRYAKEISDELGQRPLERGFLAAFAEMCGSDARVGDIGCGPGHVAGHLATLGLAVEGIDLSPKMVAIASAAFPLVSFRQGALHALPIADGSWDGAVAMFSIIHLRPVDRLPAYREFARVLRPGGLLVVSFHVRAPGQPTGSRVRLDEWWDEKVGLDAWFIDPDEVAAGLEDGGFAVVARLERAPAPSGEYPSRRCYLLARRSG
jgi:SAM-dependent methyltransferase